MGCTVILSSKGCITHGGASSRADPMDTALEDEGEMAVALEGNNSWGCVLHVYGAPFPPPPPPLLPPPSMGYFGVQSAPPSGTEA